MKPTKALLRLLPILLFVGVVVSINFFHTETSAAGSQNCPACQFLSSALSTLAVVVAVLAFVLIVSALAVIEPARSFEAVVFDLYGRSPPTA